MSDTKAKQHGEASSRTETVGKASGGTRATGKKGPRTKSRDKEVFPEYNDIPRDPSDWRYTQSFCVADGSNSWEEVRRFFQEWGFVVLRQVLSQRECRATLDTMWETIEHTTQGISRHDSSTWASWKAGSFGMPGRDPRWEHQLLCNRQNPMLHRLFAELMEDENLLVSHDRWTLYRPTKGGEAGLVADHEEWATRTNVHLDLNPWRYVCNDEETKAATTNLSYADLHDFVRENNLVTEDMGPVLQGTINLCDNLAEDGGFLIIPQFHLAFDEWLQSLGPKMTQPTVGS